MKSLLLATSFFIGGSTVLSAQSYPLAQDDAACKRFVLETPEGAIKVRVKALGVKTNMAVAKAVKDSADPLSTQIANCFDKLSARSKVMIDSLERRKGKVIDTLKVTLSSGTVPIPEKKLNLILIKEHSDYQALKEWKNYLVSKQELSETERRTLNESFAKAKTLVHDALAQRNLNEVFSAVLRTGAVVGNTAKTDGGTTPQKEKVSAQLAWESKHLGAESYSRWDVSLSGRLGFVPALTLVKTETTAAASATAADVKTEGMYQEAFAWDISPRVNFAPQTSRNAMQISGVFRVGQTLLNTQSVLEDNGRNSTLIVPIGNDAAKAELFFEGGVEFKIFNNPLDVIHAEGSVNSPVFTMNFVGRKDNRFKKTGELVEFDHPEWRGSVGFLLDALRVVDKRGTAEDGRTFTLGFGVEHEFALRRPGDGPRIPAGTKLIFRGDVNLLRALQGR